MTTPRPSLTGFARGEWRLDPAEHPRPQRPKRRWPFRLLIVLLVLVFAGWAFAYDDADYCRETAKAERLGCHAEHMENLAACAYNLAFDRWIDSPDAEEDARACREDAADGCTDCRAMAGCVTAP